MNYTESLTRYTANFVDELAENGVENVVISPGSRSTPLALVFSEYANIKEWIIIDERSAAYFALGLAKKTNYPVVLLCTSGTAAANYYPALIEAYYSRVPLLLITSDRPHELRQVGAPQAIEQIKMYGDYVKWFHEMATPDGSTHMLRYARQKAAQSVLNTKIGNAGPVHLNMPFKEPLIPDFTLPSIWKIDEQQLHSFNYLEGKKLLSEQNIASFIELLNISQKGLIVCGPQMDEIFVESVCAFSAKWSLPVLADPLSQVRCGSHTKENIIEAYDAILRDSEIRNSLQPDFIIRFGAMPVSKAYSFFVQEHRNTMQYIVEENEGFRNPSGNSVTFIYADPNIFCRQIAEKSINEHQASSWLEKWKKLNQIAKRHLLDGKEEQITEGEVVRTIAIAIPDNSTLFVGNSMAVRDVDSFFMTSPKKVSIIGNRGANGIDGVISSAVGASAAGERVTLLIGDLSFYHDMNGLLEAKQYELPITIVLVNNNGGGIFSFLPQVENKKYFETLFGTPLDLSFHHVASLYKANYSSASSADSLESLLLESYQQKGLSIIEVQTNRDSNTLWHQKKWTEILKEIKEV